MAREMEHSLLNERFKWCLADDCLCDSRAFIAGDPRCPCLFEDRNPFITRELRPALRSGRLSRRLPWLGHDFPPQPTTVRNKPARFGQLLPPPLADTQLRQH